MKPIITLTVNPSVDTSWEVEDVVPVVKMRASPARTDPGGGGINVSRVIKILGGETIAVYLAGGVTGTWLNQSLDQMGLDRCLIPIAGPTRLSAMIYERSTGQEFRVIPPGPEVSESEWQSCLHLMSALDAEYIVATGSLPRGVPNDFYARVARLAKARGARLILDTSGMPLFEALKEGVHLVKPNQRELERLMARKARTPADQEALVSQLVAERRADIVALTLGPDGALLAWDGGTRRLPSPKVEVRSAVGAGDSFVGAMTLGLAQGRPIEDAFALAVATGAATCMTSGTQLCRREDVERLYAELRAKHFGSSASGRPGEGSLPAAASPPG